jgi:hypothetical protein
MPDNPLIKKLVIKPNYRMAILNAPQGYRDLLGTLPEGTQVSDQLEGVFDLIQAFFIKNSELTPQIDILKSHLKSGGLLWVCYPKSGKLGTDLKRDPMYAQLLQHGLEGVAMIAIDDNWSAMRLKVIS